MDVPEGRKLFCMDRTWKPINLGFPIKLHKRHYDAKRSEVRVFESLFPTPDQSLGSWFRSYTWKILTRRLRNSLGPYTRFSFAHKTDCYRRCEQFLGSVLRNKEINFEMCLQSGFWPEATVKQANKESKRDLIFTCCCRWFWIISYHGLLVADKPSLNASLGRHRISLGIKPFLAKADRSRCFSMPFLGCLSSAGSDK